MTRPILSSAPAPPASPPRIRWRAWASASCWSTRKKLGGAPILSGYAKLVPSGEWAKDAIGGMVRRVEESDLVSVQKNKSRKIRRRARQLRRDALRRLHGRGSRRDPVHRVHALRFGEQARVGLRHLPRRGHHHAGGADDLLGRGIRCPSDGRKPQRVAILLCVGSRDRQIGREWCSKICCTVSCNIAMEIREELPDCHVYIYYMDIRTYGLYETKYYWKSQEEFKVKYIKARIAEVTSDGNKLIVKGEDTLVKRPITIPFDMVVHAIGMDPNVDNKSIAARRGPAGTRPYRQGQRLRLARRDLARGRVRRRRRHRPRDHRRFDRAGQGRGHGRVRAREPEGAGRGVSMQLVERPRLELSGPRLKLALEALVSRAEELGASKPTSTRCRSSPRCSAMRSRKNSR